MSYSLPTPSSHPLITPPVPEEYVNGCGGLDGNKKPEAWCVDQMAVLSAARYRFAWQVTRRERSRQQRGSQRRSKMKLSWRHQHAPRGRRTSTVTFCPTAMPGPDPSLITVFLKVAI